MRERKRISSMVRFAGAAGCALAIPLLVAGESLAINAQPPVMMEEPGVTTRAKTRSAAADEALELSLDQAMWAAIAFEDEAQLAAALRRGADPNKPEKFSQMTPLMTVETLALVKALLDGGAKPDLRDVTGRNALHYAVLTREAPAIVKMLVAAGAEVDGRVDDMNGSTPLLLAAEHYMDDRDRRPLSEAIRTLVALGAKIDAADKGGRNALAIAAANNQVDLVRLLLELGADPKHPLANGRTPLDIAVDAKAQDAASALAAAPSKSPARN